MEVDPILATQVRFPDRVRTGGHQHEREGVRLALGRSAAQLSHHALLHRRRPGRPVGVRGAVEEQAQRRHERQGRGAGQRAEEQGLLFAVLTKPNNCDCNIKLIIHEYKMQNDMKVSLDQTTARARGKASALISNDSLLV